MKSFFKYVGIGVLVALAMLLAWGLVEPHLLDVEHEEVQIAGLPRSWDGQRIAQLSDFQFGMWLDNEDTAEDAIELLVDRKPALVLLSGDFVYHSQESEDLGEDLQAVTRLVRPLVEADIPTFAVLGNHDYGVATPGEKIDRELAATVAEALRRAGVVVLENEAVRLPPPSGASVDAPASDPLFLVGIGSHYARNDDVAKALANLPDSAARVAMMHHPDSFEHFPANTAPLAVAGHTHGGQIRLPGLPSFSYQTFTKSDEVHVDGWIDDYGKRGNRLYINRGIGMSLVPLRINCAPELTFITLRRAATKAQPSARR